jgi:hypothetical protein
MKKRLIQSAFYSFFMTLYGLCFYYAIGLALTLAQGEDVAKFLVDTLIAGVLCFGFLTYVFYELTGLFEKANQPRDDRKDEDSKPKK